ncbi:MAG: restriction endonuclease subunit S [Candidatus Omnitrophica bacterium]|nr:restriction endonuclease subunit S [Candidatus Omnitrophota bacterium]
MKQTTYLKTIAEVSAGQGAPQGQQYFGKVGHPFVRAGSLEFLLSGGDENSLEKINDDVAKKFQLRLFPEGTILFAKSGMSATKDRVYVLQNSCYVVSHLATIIPKKEIDSEFLKYWFRRFRPSQLIRDKAYPSIRLSDIEEIKVPSVSEPIKIKTSAILAKAESTIEKRAHINKLTDEFLKSAFLEMFGDPVKNTKGWGIAFGKDLFILSSGKFNPSKNLDNSYPYPSYGGNGIMGYFNDYLVEFPTIVIGRVGVYCGCVHLTRGKCWVSDNAIYIKQFKKDIDLQFLFYLLWFHQLNRYADISGQPKITQKPLEKLKVILPPLPQQKKFATLVQKVESLKQKQKESEKELNNLFNSLMQEAFQGEFFS